MFSDAFKKKIVYDATVIRALFDNFVQETRDFYCSELE